MEAMVMDMDTDTVDINMAMVTDTVDINMAMVTITTINMSLSMKKVEMINKRPFKSLKK